MKNQKILLATIISATLPTALCEAQEVQSSMHKLLVPLRTLQPFLADEDKFTDSDNSDQIHEQLIALSKQWSKLAKTMRGRERSM